MNKAEHRIRMQERRARQLARTPGFTPIRNRRIDDAIRAAGALLMLQNAASALAGLASSMSSIDAHSAARRQVARTLPSPRMVFDWRNGLPTRNDNPEYRK